MREYKPGPLPMSQVRRREAEAEALCGWPAVHDARAYHNSSSTTTKVYKVRLRQIIKEATHDD